MDRAAWRSTVHGVTKNEWLSMPAYTCPGKVSALWVEWWAAHVRWLRLLYAAQGHVEHGCCGLHPV